LQQIVRLSSSTDNISLRIPNGSLLEFYFCFFYI
jgi:hypothetical protein